MVVVESFGIFLAHYGTSKMGCRPKALAFTMMPRGVFTTIDGKAYIEIDGYFSSDMEKKIPFDKSGGYEYLVEHVVEPYSMGVPSRAYYRKASVGSAVIDAVFTSTNVVKKAKSLRQ